MKIDWTKIKHMSYVLFGLLALSPATASAAEPTATDVAPPLSFCLPNTFHCMVPDFNLNTVSYDLGAKKWKTGVTQIGVGYSFLLYSNQPWSFGPALHGAGQWSQGQPSFFALTPTVVFFKVFEVGATFRFLDGAIEKDLTLGLAANAEAIVGLLTGKSIEKRLLTARLAYWREQDRATAMGQRSDLQ